MLLSEVVDELLDDNGLADACAAEQAGLAALDERLDEVDGLDAGLEDLRLGGQLIIFGSRTVNRHVAGHIGHRLLVNRLAHDVPDAAQGLVANGHHDRMTGVKHLEATNQTVSRAHSDGADEVAREMRFDFENDMHVARERLRVNRKSVVDSRHGFRGEFHVDNRTDDTHNAAGSALAGLELLSCKQMFTHI